jgi:hypothetical protein
MQSATAAEKASTDAEVTSITTAGAAAVRLRAALTALRIVRCASTHRARPFM